jgi:hypothetical protein
MINSKNKKCISCGREDQPHFSKKRCKACAQKDYAKKAQQKREEGFTMSSSPKKKTYSKILRKASGEGILFKAIWDTRPHESFISGVHLGDEAKAHFFAHLLPKGQYPKYRLLDRNIVLLSMEEHAMLDAGTEAHREMYVKFMLANHGVVVDWNKLSTLVEELKQEYNNGNN